MIQTYIVFSIYNDIGVSQSGIRPGDDSDRRGD